MTEIPDISPQQRRKEIAQHDYDTMYREKQPYYMEKYGVSQPTITADKKTDDYLDHISKIDNHILDRLKIKSFRFAETVVDEAQDAANAEMPVFEQMGEGRGIITVEFQEMRWQEQRNREKDRGAKMVQWYLEKSGRINDKSDADPSNKLDKIRDLVNQDDTPE